MTELAFESALSLAEKIRHKEISAVELLEFYLQRVEQYNPALNAIIFTQIEKARQQAEGGMPSWPEARTGGRCMACQ